MRISTSTICDNILFWGAIALVLAAYLNIGWALGTYHHNYIFGHEPQTFWQTLWAGGFGIWTTAPPQGLLFDQIVFMFLWLVLVGITLVFWLAYFAYWLLWLIFAGGAAKLLGLG